MNTSSLAALACSLAFAASAALSGTPDIPDSKKTTAGLYLSAVEAVAFLEDPAVVFIDVRSRPEVAFLGLPTRVDKHIPFMVMPRDPVYDAEDGTYKLVPNDDFATEFEIFAMERGIWSDTPIVLMCRSGSRSAKAANLLNQLGYSNVWSVVDGYEGDKAADGPEKGHRTVNGWKNAGLAWSYTITPEQHYPADF